MGRSLWEELSGPSQETRAAENKAMIEKAKGTKIKATDSGETPRREVLQEGRKVIAKDRPETLGGPGSLIDKINKRKKLPEDY